MVDNVGDVVTESGTDTADQVQSSVTYTLATNVENLTLTGAAAINGTGNTLANTITGNVHDTEGGTTFCPGCATPLIQRDWHAVMHYDVDPQGGCPHCGTRIAGHFAPKLERSFGRRRIPVRVAPR